MSDEPTARPERADHAAIATNREALLHDFTRALEALAQLVKARREITRRDVRAVLLPLGGLLSEEGSTLGTESVARLRDAIAPIRARWDLALASELEIAAAEFVQAVDPRYLRVPAYDFAYTLDSRERLEARRIAAHALGARLPDATNAQVERADAWLEQELQRRAGSPEPD